MNFFSNLLSRNESKSSTFNVRGSSHVTISDDNLDSVKRKYIKTKEDSKTDMVIVYSSKVSDRRLDTYKRNLEIAGFTIEEEAGIMFPDLRAVKIYAPDKVLNHYSQLFKYELTRDNPNWVWIESEACCRVSRSALTHPSRENMLLVRAADSVARVRPNTFTNIERIMLVNKVMINNQCWTTLGETLYGYEILKKNKIIIDAYALHESTWKWSMRGQLKDRQLLFKYWANMRNVFKLQPIFMVEKYFGTEAGFYFVYCGFYIRMLIILSFFGLLAFGIGIMELFTPELGEFCHLDLPICPVCQDFNACPMDNLSSYCDSKWFALLFDNTANMVFGMVVSVWSIVYVILWKRHQATMALRWNVRRMKYREQLMPEFLTKATVVKLSRFTQKQILDIPVSLKVRGYVVSYVSVVLLLCCCIGVILLTSFYRKVLHVLKTSSPSETSMIITISASVIYYVVVVLVISPLIKKLAVVLTVLECHRTQAGYECATLYKSCIMSVPSFYGIIIYLSFFKGKFVTLPTDASRWTTVGGIPADGCNPAGCMIDVTVQLLVMLSTDAVKTICNTVYVMYMSYFMKVHLLKYYKKKKNEFDIAPRWEKDYLKVAANRNDYINRYKQRMINYGFITWFSAVCPLIPIIALFQYMIQLRLDAFQALIVNRREIGEKVSSIGCWNNVLIIITFCGVLTNGMMMAFSSSIVHRYVYAANHGWSLKGYVKHSLVEFDTKQYSKMTGVTLPEDGNIPDVCYYRGYKYAPQDKEMFMYTNDYWTHVTTQIQFIFIFENMIFALAAIMFILIPLVPHEVTLKYNDEEDEIRDKRIELLNVRYKHMKEQENPEA